MKFTPAFANSLKQRLTIGNSGSIMLNSTPGRLLCRMPLTDFDVIKANLANEFLSVLTSQKTFSFKVAINFGGRNGDAQAKLGRIGKRMSAIKFDYDDYLKEHGVETFGFGYPILLRQNPKDAAKVIAAPIFIFPLHIKQSFDKQHEWIISRDNDSEIRVNEVLASFLENEEHVKIPSIPEEMLEDGILDNNEINTLCNELLSRFILEEQLSAVTFNQPVLEPFPEKLKNTEESNAGKIMWNGVFGIYKSQKQNLIKEIDLLLSDFGNLTGENDLVFNWSNSHSPMNTDPSQNGVLRTLKDSRNVVIQGPPGTGKSQTLTALISSALANKKKILVVCEKRTALEVLKTNLEKLIPESKKAIALIEDISRDRGAIVETVRGRTAAFLVNQHQLQKIINDDISTFEGRAQLIDKQYHALKLPIWRNIPWSGLVAKWMQSPKQDKHKLYQLQKIFRQNNTTDDAYESLYRTIEEGARLFAKTKDPNVIFQDLQFPSVFSKGYHREVIHAINDAFYKTSALTSDIEQIKKDIRHIANEEISVLVNKFRQDISKLSEILSSVDVTNTDLFQLSFKVKLLALFSDRWKNIVHISEKAKILRNQLHSCSEQLFGKPFRIEDVEGQAKFALDQQSTLSEVKYIKLLNFKLSQSKLETKYFAAGNDISAALTEVQANLQTFIAGNSGAPRCDSIQEIGESVVSIKQNLEQLLKLEDEMEDYISWKSFRRKLSAFEEKWIEGLISNASEDWLKTTNDAWVYYTLLEQDQEEKFPIDDSSLRIIRDLGIKIQKNQTQLVNQNLDDWFVSGQNRIKQLGIQVNQLFNLRGSKGSTRNSLRKIVHSDLIAFTDFFPVVMLNPGTCSSLLPLEKGFFDLVIFDEASQLRIEDTFTALLRGKQVVVSGDSQQMPPSSYFSSSSQLLEDDTDNEEERDEDGDGNSKLVDDANKDLASKKSLLDFAIDAGYMETYLDMHYRSKHPDLIEFSNVCFYSSRLVPMPEKSSELPMTYIQVNGLYEGSQNRKEAEEIIRILKNEISETHSVGIATFNLPQRNLILTMIGEERINDKEFHRKMTVYEENGFFVKNLENIQGDEKDIILISTTFGVKTDGKFLMNFGPVGKQNGHRLFNVIITRAKIKVYVLTSIPENRILEYRDRLEADGKVDGRTGLLAYLDYSRAVSNRDDTEKANILEFIKSKISRGQSLIPGTALGLTESPFEEEVYCWLAEVIGAERIILQYKCGGFRIDMVVLSKLPNSKVKLAIECDGAAYHSDQLSWHYDIYRQDQLEQEGFIFHRIWSTNWWRKPEKELDKLLEVIKGLN